MNTYYIRHKEDDSKFWGEYGWGIKIHANVYSEADASSHRLPKHGRWKIIMGKK